jgi:hypothetical protein
VAPSFVGALAALVRRAQAGEAAAGCRYGGCGRFGICE